MKKMNIEIPSHWFHTSFIIANQSNLVSVQEPYFDRQVSKTDLWGKATSSHIKVSNESFSPEIPLHISRIPSIIRLSQGSNQSELDGEKTWIKVLAKRL